MTNPNPTQIVAAAERLAKAGLRNHVERLLGASEQEVRQITPTIWMHMTDILTLADAGELIAKTLRNDPKAEFTDYDPGVLNADLCRRFSQLPQYAQVSTDVRRVVTELGYAEVIGVFLAKGPAESKRFVQRVPGVGKKTTQKFLDWAQQTFAEEGIVPSKEDLKPFEKFTTLAQLMRNLYGGDSFKFLKESSDRRLLDSEPILAADCERLITIGIKTTLDLALTSIDDLKAKLGNDELILRRLAAFLKKRDLAFGMNFLPIWES